MKKLIAACSLLTLSACGNDGRAPTNQSSSSPTTSNASPAPSPTLEATRYEAKAAHTGKTPTSTVNQASSPDAKLSPKTTDDQAARVRMADITAIEAGPAEAGQMTVKVTYARRCQDTFQRLINEKVAPLGLANQVIAVGVVVEASPAACQGPEIKETKTFSVPTTGKAPRFEKIMPATASFARGQDLGTANIREIKAVSPLENRVDVKVTYARACYESFEGFSKTLVAPLSVEHPHFAIGVLLKTSAATCHTPDVVETASFTLPAIRGSYRFSPVAKN